MPWSKKIDGKTRNLAGRKFCLVCSPFGSHNTRKDDPSRQSKSHNRPWKDRSEEERLLYTAKVYKKGMERKARLIEISGGKCKICGYSKCHRALTFHHRDPETKEFGLALNFLRIKSWEAIVKEAEKCDLLCIRCHMEIEAEMTPVNEKSYRAIIDRYFRF